MSTVLDKKVVLVLSAILWQPIGYISIRKAIKAMYSDDVDAVQALDLTYPLNAEGYLDFKSCPTTNIVGINEWVKLPLRDFDIPIHTAKSVIRAPIVVITHNCKKMVFKQLKPTRRNLWEFYGRKCIWTGKEISYNECTKEHMITRSSGGDESWLNLAPASKHLNHERGNLPLDKWKYKPQYSLKEPKRLPISSFIRTAIRPEWEYFLQNEKV
jgi:hypothetical protein